MNCESFLFPAMRWYLYLDTSVVPEKEVIISGKRGAGLDSPLAILLQIAVPDFIIAVAVTVVGCHSKHSCDSMV